MSDSKSNERLYWMAVSEGDDAAATALVARLEHLIVNAARKIVFSDADAREVAAIVLGKLLKPTDSPTRLEHVAAYVNTAARNTSLSLISQQRRYESLPTDHSAHIFSFLNVENEGASSLSKNDRDLVRSRVRDAVDLLIPSQRDCIRLFYFSDYSYKEIQEELNYTAREVKSQIQNGKKRLKNILSKYRRQL